MFNDIFTIIKKECARFFKDSRMVLTTIIMPALMFFGMFILMGSFLEDNANVPEDYRFPCYVENLPESFAAGMDAMGFDVMEVTDLENAKEQVSTKEADLLVIFPADFDAQISQSGENVPDIQVYYNSDRVHSQVAYDLFEELANGFEDSFVNILDINRDNTQINLARTSSLTNAMLPMMILCILFMGVQSTAPEAIAGEKERGTIATLLVTPVRRSSIAIGKVVSLCIFAILSAIASFSALILSTATAGDMAQHMFDLSACGFREYGLLFAILLSTILLDVALLSLISVNAKSVKEANASSLVLLLPAILIGMLPMLSLGLDGLVWRFVPMINSAQSLYDIVTMNYSVTNIVITCLSNVVIMAGLVAVISKMFNSEKVMFNK